MIYGIGTDIVVIERIERLLEVHGDRVAEKMLTQSELAEYRTALKPAAFLAKRFAAKEALGKALRLGLRAPATLHNIAIVHDDLGRPGFECGAPLAAHLAERELRTHLSISDESGSAIAFVIVEQMRAA
jgi:holo-[acyl-carrier protein] synthase